MSVDSAASDGSRSRPRAVAAEQALRLTLFAPNLSGGGAERTLARLATHWAKQNREVTLVTLAAASPEDFPLPPNVHRIGLGMTAESAGPIGALRNNLARVRALRGALRTARPDVVVSFIEQANVLALLAAKPLKVPVVITERTDPSRHHVGRFWNWLRRKTYPHCAALVVLTEEIAAAMKPVAAGRPVVVIANGVAVSTACPLPKESGGDRIVLGVGRLSREKGFDLLIAAFAAAAVDHPGWRLVLLGEGPERAALEAQAVRCGIAGRVDLPGRVVDPATWYARADLFCLSSRYEGFPNALLEAMSHGLPAVALDGPPAVRQVIRHDVDGLLVPDGEAAALEHALSRLLGDERLRRRLATAARDVADRFSLATFYERWDRVIDDFRQPFGPDRE